MGQHVRRSGHSSNITLSTLIFILSLTLVYIHKPYKNKKDLTSEDYN